MGRFLSSKALKPPLDRPIALAPAPITRVFQTKPAVKFAAQPIDTFVSSAEENNPLRKICFFFSLATLFLFVTVLPELLLYITNTNTYLLYIFAPPAILGALLTGGVRRTLKFPAARLFICFFVWMVIAVPFSYWKGGSTATVSVYARFTLPLLFVAGGIAVTWKELRAVFNTIALAGIVNLFAARIFNHVDEGGRNSLTASGTIGNSNDLAAHLLLVLPFLLFVVRDSQRNRFFRYPLVTGIAYGIFIIIGTASRGALLAMTAVFLFMLWRGTTTQRILALAVGGGLALTIPLLLPGSTFTRLGTLLGDKNTAATESADFRQALFRTSVRYTIQHPIFGVGPDQFSNYEGNESVENGVRGAWHATHCSWTQISAECGIPALIFFVSALGSALWLVHKTWREARDRGYQEIVNACFCYMTAMVGFLVAVSFLSNAYRFYFPVMIGLAISMRVVAVRTMGAAQPASAPAMPRTAPTMIPAYPLMSRS